MVFFSAGPWPNLANPDDERAAGEDFVEREVLPRLGEKEELDRCRVALAKLGRRGAEAIIAGNIEQLLSDEHVRGEAA